MKIFLKIFLLFAIIAPLGYLGQVFFHTPHHHTFITLSILLGVGCVIMAWQLVLAFKRKVPFWGGRFRFRFTLIFSVLFVIPCIIIAIFAIFFLKIGLETWFQQRIRVAMDEAQNIADVYMREQEKNVEHAVVSVLEGLHFFSSVRPKNYFFSEQEIQSFFMRYRDDLNDYLTFHEAFGLVKEAIIFRTEPFFSQKENQRIFFEVVAKSRLTLSLGFKKVTLNMIQKSNEEGLFLSLNEEGDQVFAIVPLFLPMNAYLMISRDVDKSILQKIKKATDASSSYRYLIEKQSDLTVQFVVVFILFTLFLLLMVIRGGFSFSRQFMDPIEKLIAAAQSIREGVLQEVECDVSVLFNDLQSLISTFNVMVTEIAKQKERLVLANQKLEERTQFIENVLSGVSSGVLSVTRQGVILLHNQQAQRVLHQKEAIEKKNILLLLPEVISLFQSALESPHVFYHSEFTALCGGRPRILQAHILSTLDSYIVLTLDDITERVLTQKKAAWGDVAQRIAHEVKNPLTPIVLSAERLKRKYRQSLGHDELFQDCIETIIRQVQQIGKLIAEFSLFARMPIPLLKKIDILQLLKQQVTFYQQAYPDVSFICKAYEGPCMINCDAQHVERVFTNIFKNAIESIAEKGHPGVITVSWEQTQTEGGQKNQSSSSYSGHELRIYIQDNGLGLSPDVENALGDAYVTNKAQGTGLGLTIVDKIMEDHSGWWRIRSNEDHQGVCVILAFPLEA